MEGEFQGRFADLLEIAIDLSTFKCPLALIVMGTEFECETQFYQNDKWCLISILPNMLIIPLTRK